MKKKIILGVVGFIILLGIIGAATGGNKSSQTSNNPPSAVTSTEQKTEQPKAEEIAKIGQAVEDGGLSFTATDMTTSSSLGNQFTRRDAQGLFYIVTLKVENKTKETKTIDSSQFQLVDSQDRKYDRSIEGQTAKGMSTGKVDLFLQQVQPGLSATGDIVFDAPKDATGLKLIVKGSLFSGGKKIDLGR